MFTNIIAPCATLLRKESVRALKQSRGFSNLIIKKRRRRPSIIMAEKPETLVIKKQNFDYFLVLDFEATCDDSRKIHPQVN